MKLSDLAYTKTVTDSHKIRFGWHWYTKFQRDTGKVQSLVSTNIKNPLSPTNIKKHDIVTPPSPTTYTQL